MTRLTQSLLCAGLLLCAARPAPAGIVHVPINQSVSAGFTYNPTTMDWQSETASYDLDIDGDGTNDLTFSEQSMVATGTRAGWDNNVIPLNGASVGAVHATAPLGAPQYQATPLLSSDTVGPNVNFGPANTLTTLYSNDANMGPLGSPAWTNPPDKYLPVQFDINGSTHYGWVHLNIVWDSTFQDVSRIQLYDAAYETTPNTPLPEPTTLSLLTLTALPLFSRNRRT